MKPVITSQKAILDTCRNMVTTQGLSAINMRSVAKACGVAVGSLYNYFPSKDDLLQATVCSVWMDIFCASSNSMPCESFSGVFAMDVFKNAMGVYTVSGLFNFACNQLHRDKPCTRTAGDGTIFCALEGGYAVGVGT